MSLELPKMPTPEELAKKQQKRAAPAERSKKIVTLPQISERDLGIDLTKLGAIDSGGINDTAIYQSYLEKTLNPINDLFTNKALVAKLLVEMEKMSDRNTVHAYNDENEQLSRSEVMTVFTDFLKCVSRGDEAGAKSALKRAATPSLQHSVVEVRATITNLIRDSDMSQVVYCFFELSESIYKSSHDGQRYRSKEEQDEIEEIKQRGNQFNIS
jgi:hypothetical protein